MTRPFPRWGLALLLAAMAFMGMFAISLLSVPGEQETMTIRTHGLPDVSRHNLPRSVRAQAAPRQPQAIWLVREGAAWRALSARSAHPNACDVVWKPEHQRFVDPCLGTTYSRTGLYIAGPALGGLDHYPARMVEPGLVEVDVTRPESASRP